jgi:hypothetical protein
MWLYETPKVGEMDMAMPAVQEMPPSSASSFWIARVRLGHAAATLPGSSGFRASAWIRPFPMTAMHRRDEILASSFSSERLQLSCFVGIALAQGARVKAHNGRMEI